MSLILFAPRIRLIVHYLIRYNATADGCVHPDIQIVEIRVVQNARLPWDPLLIMEGAFLHLNLKSILAFDLKRSVSFVFVFYSYDQDNIAFKDTISCLWLPRCTCSEFPDGNI